MSFLERYFAALDGPDRFSSIEMVADDAEFSIQWATPDGRSRQLVGGRAELRRFVEADDMEGWAHHILAGAADGNVEFAVGETRYDDGRRISTFAVTVELDEHGRMTRYMVARSPAIAFRTDDRNDA
jgi:hypothetical protein